MNTRRPSRSIRHRPSRSIRHRPSRSIRHRPSHSVARCLSRWTAHRPGRRIAAIALTGLTALLVAACGGASKPPKSPGSARTPQNSGAQAAYRFSACMRTHGVSNFQDPHVSHQGDNTKVAIQVDPAITSSPDFKSAQKACAHLLPNGGNGGNGGSAAQTRAREQAMLAFANCMRRRGFPKFPDPTAQGQLTLAMITQAGIDLRQPAVKPAAYACIPLTHGLITRADVDQAVSSPSGSGPQSGSGAGG